MQSKISDEARRKVVADDRYQPTNLPTCFVYRVKGGPDSLEMGLGGDLILNVPKP